MSNNNNKYDYIYIPGKSMVKTPKRKSKYDIIVVPPKKEIPVRGKKKKK